MRKIIASSLLILTLFGCMIGPNYKRPLVDSPQAWRFEDKEAKDVVNTAWWEQFNDQVLNELIQTSIRENKDLRIATARVEEFIGLYRVIRSNQFPQVYGGGTAGMERITRKGAPVPLAPTVNDTYDFYNALISASWELDVWGKLRRATEAARADLLSTEEGRRTVILTLVSAVANTYIDLRELDRELEISKRTAQSRGESYNLFKIRFEGGVISELELNQVKSEYEEALAVIPQTEKFVAQTENALSILLGRNPGPIPRGRTIDELVLPVVPAGLPSDLLERRPDIRQAEQDLIAANARIGVARSQYFPTISLTGTAGTQSSQLSDLFTGPARTWSYAGQLITPIFTAGRIAGEVKAAEAIQQQSLSRYEQAIQNAFREVEDSLIDQNKSRERLQAQNRQVEALSTSARVARLRYDEGYTSYIEVLDAERSLFNVELSYTQTQAVLFKALVNLYKAMGGGWIAEAEGLATQNTGAEPSGDEKMSQGVK